MSIKVKALTNGFYDGSRVRSGAIFEIPDKSVLGKWMEVVEEPKPKPVVNDKPKPPVSEKAKLDK
jgi:hypothetical protein